MTEVCEYQYGLDQSFKSWMHTLLRMFRTAIHRMEYYEISHTQKSARGKKRTNILYLKVIDSCVDVEISSEDIISGTGWVLPSSVVYQPPIQRRTDRCSFPVPPRSVRAWGALKMTSHSRLPIVGG